MATNFVKSIIQEVYDLSTQDTGTSVLKVHTPVGNNVKTHLAGFFMQFKQFKYVGAKVTLVPASTLPADPLQLSYEAGEPTIDPRDMVNPILFKKYHGEAMQTDVLPSTEIAPDGFSQAGSNAFTVAEQMFANDDGGSRTIYNKCLCDPSFRKCSIQSGFSIFVKPYAYNLASYHQALAGADGETLWHATHSGTNGYTSVSGPVSQEGKLNSGGTAAPWTWPQGMMFTNKLTPVGWMDTVQSTMRDSGSGAPPVNFAQYWTNFYLPKLPMLYVMLPPAYKTEFYFRLVITHYFEFRGFRSCWNIQGYASVPAFAADPIEPATGVSGPAPDPSLPPSPASLSKDMDTIEAENMVIASSTDGAF